MEAMASESLVASAWELDGLLTKTRWPIRVQNGYSDIDVVGVNAAGIVRLAECKVRGPARGVFVVPNDFHSWIGEWGKCINNITRLWDEPPNWLPIMSDVSHLEMWFCGNIWFASEDDKRDAEAGFTKMVRDACPHGLKLKAVGRVESTRDIFMKVIADVRSRIIDDGHGKRFGNPLLDAIRELVRYSNPQPHDGGRVGNQISVQTREDLLRALGMDI